MSITEHKAPFWQKWLDIIGGDTKQIEAIRQVGESLAISIGEMRAEKDRHENRLKYIASYWHSQIFGETMELVSAAEFLTALDRLMDEHPEGR